MVTTTPTSTILSQSWSLENKFAYIDTSSQITWIPETYFDFVMEDLLKSSVGFYFDTELDLFVLSCDQYTVLDDVYIKLVADSSFTG